MLSNPNAAYLPSDERLSSHWLGPTNSERLSDRVVVSARVSGSRLAVYSCNFSYRQNLFFVICSYPICFSGSVNIPWICGSQPPGEGVLLELGRILQLVLLSSSSVHSRGMHGGVALSGGGHCLYRRPPRGQHPSSTAGVSHKKSTTRQRLGGNVLWWL